MRALVLAVLIRWASRPAAFWQFWLPQSSFAGGAVIGTAIVVVALMLSGCTVVPSSTARSACELLHTASTEADLAPAWYLRAGEVLEACGQERVKADAAARACYAEARNGYRDSKECEAMP